LAGIGQRWLGMERAMGIEPKPRRLIFLAGLETYDFGAQLRVIGV